ncbi:Uncharacterised protein [Vibrio cholerae]|nr:Uncharacterised protein [Vibrio cholerae]
MVDPQHDPQHSFQGRYGSYRQGKSRRLTLPLWHEISGPSESQHHEYDHARRSHHLPLVGTG